MGSWRRAPCLSGSKGVLSPARCWSECAHTLHFPHAASEPDPNNKEPGNQSPRKPWCCEKGALALCSSVWPGLSIAATVPDGGPSGQNLDTHYLPENVGSSEVEQCASSPAHPADTARRSSGSAVSRGARAISGNAIRRQGLAGRRKRAPQEMRGFFGGNM